MVLNGVEGNTARAAGVKPESEPRNATFIVAKHLKAPDCPYGERARSLAWYLAAFYCARQDDGTLACFPSLETMGKALSPTKPLSVDSVRRALHELTQNPAPRWNLFRAVQPRRGEMLTTRSGTGKLVSHPTPRYVLVASPGGMHKATLDATLGGLAGKREMPREQRQAPNDLKHNVALVKKRQMFGEISADDADAEIAALRRRWMRTV